MIKPGHIEIFVSDVERSKLFYRNILGFELTVDGAELAWLQLGHLEVLLRPGSPPEAAPKYEAGSSALVLYTDDLTGTARLLESRGLLFRGTVDSEKCLTFTDPDGNWFQLVDPHDH